MNWRHYLVLALLGLGILNIVSKFESAPGYMDADYYYAGGLQLAQGRGFTEPFLWNYLDDPAGLPHPSHAYWMPLASLLAAAGAIFKPASWAAGRAWFILVAAAVPPLTAALAWRLTRRRSLALISGLLGVFSAFYLPFLPVTDTFGLYMVCGCVFFILISYLPASERRVPLPLLAAGLGLVAGLMHLTRADGLLWLLIALIGIVISHEKGQPWRASLFAGLAVLAGYLLVMGPWFIRNFMTFGSPLGPGGARMLWLTNYDEIFVYPASRLSFAAWWQSGLGAILKARGWALGVNLERTLAEQGEIFLLPFIAIGLWSFRREKTIHLAGLAWLLTLAAMTLAFPFAGARGSYFHSGAALQPVWWTLAPVGLDRAIEWSSRKRNWDPARAGRLFQPTLVGLAVLLSAGIFWGKLMGTNGISTSPGDTPAPTEIWSQENTVYRQIHQYLLNLGATQSDVVMVANPPGFYLASETPSIAIPAGDTSTLLEVARRYGAVYLVMEKGSVPDSLAALYDQPDASADPTFIGQVGDSLIFRFK